MQRVKTVEFVTRPGGQTDFWNDWHNRALFLEGGWFSGKTWIGARKLLCLTIWNALDEKGQRTGVSSAMIGQTFGTMADFMYPEFESACQQFNIRHRWSNKRSAYILPQFGCNVLCRSAERADRIAGWQVGAAWGDEPARWKEDRTNPKNDPMVQLMGRVRAPRARLHQAIFTYTNEGDRTRVFEEAHSGAEGYALFRARTRDNPTAREFESVQRRVLTGELADQYLDGGALSLTGHLIYAAQFVPQIHVTPNALTVKGRPLCLAVDFNISPGMTGLLGHYIEELDLFIVVKEFHRPRLDVRQMIMGDLRNWIAAQGGGFGWPELQVYGDATAKSEWAGTSQTCYDILAQALKEIGVPFILRVPASNPPQTDRINSVLVSLRDMSGSTHLAIHPSCERLLHDIAHVRWGADGKIDKSNPELTHASDALGYWVHYLRPVRRVIVGTGGRISV